MDGEKGAVNQTFPVTISREYPPAPLVAVAAAVLDDAGRVLMVRRGKPPSLGMWALPGGLLDLGESVRDGVVREVREETGAEIELVELLDLFEPIPPRRRGLGSLSLCCYRFLGSFRGGAVAPADDADGADWVSLDRLDGLTMEDATRRVVRKAHARWAEWGGPAPELLTLPRVDLSLPPIVCLLRVWTAAAAV